MSMARLLSRILKRKRVEDKHVELKSRLNYAMSQNTYPESQHQTKDNIPK